MNVLLTGASGFTGRNLAELLSGEFALFTPGRKELDMSIQKRVDGYFEANKIDAVIHAAIKPMHRNAEDASDLIKDNLLMYYHLERNAEARGIKALFIGSGCCYDSDHYMPKMRRNILASIFLQA